MDAYDGEIDFKDHPAWQAAMALVHEVYRVTEGLPMDEGSSVAGQLRGISITVPSKIAGGLDAGDPKLLMQNLGLAYGALSELRTLFYVAHDMGEIAPEVCERLAQRAGDVGKLINRMSENLPASHPGPNGHADVDLPPYDE